MTPVRFFLAVCAFFLSVASVHAQPASRPRKIIVIDGRFFHEMPVATDKITKMHLLTTPSGASAVGFELSEPLPDAALQYAVPAGQIPEGRLLLAQYDEAKAQGRGTSLSFARKPLLEAGSRFPDFSATDIDGRTWTGHRVRALPGRDAGVVPLEGRDARRDVLFFDLRGRRARPARARKAGLQLDCPRRRHAVPRVRRPNG